MKCPKLQEKLIKALSTLYLLHVIYSTSISKHLLMVNLLIDVKLWNKWFSPFLGMGSYNTQKTGYLPKVMQKVSGKVRNECRSPLFQANLQLSCSAGTVCISYIMSRALNLCFIGCLVLTVCKHGNLMLFFPSV